MKNKTLQLLELNEITGKARDTIKKRIKEAGIRSIEGTYGPEYPAREALIAVLGPDIAAKAGNSDQLDPATEKAKLDRMRTKKLLLEYRLQKGQLVNKDAFVQSFGMKLTDMRKAILSMPTELAAALDGQDRQHIFNLLTEKAYEICESISSIISVDEATAPTLDLDMGDDLSDPFE